MEWKEGRKGMEGRKEGRKGMEERKGKAGKEWYEGRKVGR